MNETSDLTCTAPAAPLSGAGKRVFALRVRGEPAICRPGTDGAEYRRLPFRAGNVAPILASLAVFAARLRVLRRVACAAALTFAMAGAPVDAQQSSTFTPDEQAAVKALVVEAIRENPEIVVEALQALQARTEAEATAKAREAVQKRHAELVSDPNAPVIGNPQGDVTVVEFFDYNCPYCKRAAPEVAALIGQDTNLRMVMREWPILGPDSEYAARAALAARAQGKYKEFHDAMMRSTRANEATVRRVASEIGLDLDRLADDMQDPSIAAHIDQSRRLAEVLGITGTPSFVIGEAIVAGFAPRADLAALVADIRAGANAGSSGQDTPTP